MKTIVVCSTLALATSMAVAQPSGGAPPSPPPPGPGVAAPYYAPPAVRTGLTFEANLGFGLLRISNDDDSESEGALGGLNLGVGGWVNPNLAVTLRAAGVTYTEDGGSITQAFFGPSAQYFVTPNAFVGGGIGLGVARISVDGVGSDSETGFALDLRAGYTFNPDSKHAFNASIEITPAFIEELNFTGIAFLAGYQLQ